MRNHKEKRRTNQRRESTFETRQKRAQNAQFKRKLEREVIESNESEA
jgi:hypothetical protein